MAESETHDSSAVRRLARKTHTKSRTGCMNCKKRRIKCDEKKPHCSNCTRHGSACSFAPPRSSPEASSQDGLAVGTPSNTSSPSMAFGSPPSINPVPFQNNPQLLNIMDLELLHNYYTSVSLLITNNPDLQTFLRVNIPQLGFSYPFVLHSILAVSALHLSRFRSGERKTYYLSQAQNHYDNGLRSSNTLIPDANKETCPPLYIFGIFCILCTFAAGPKAGDFLLFGNQGPAQWLALFRHLAPVLERDKQSLFEKSELSPILSISNGPASKSGANDNEHIQGLRERILARSSEDPDLQIYLSALEQLSMSLPSSSTGARTAEGSPQSIFTWLHGLSQEFVVCLQQRKPMALVILAHFCVMLNCMSTLWWVRGWPEHLISEIYASLDSEYQLWLQWPLEEIGIPE